MTQTVSVGQMTDDEVRRRFLEAEVTVETLQRQLNDMGVQIRAQVQQERALNYAGEQEMIAEFNRLKDAWLSSIRADLTAIALRIYTIEDMRTMVQLRLDHPGLFERSARCQIEASRMVSSNFENFNRQITEAYQKLQDFRRYRY